MILKFNYKGIFYEMDWDEDGYYNPHKGYRGIEGSYLDRIPEDLDERNIIDFVD